VAGGDDEGDEAHFRWRRGMERLICTEICWIVGGDRDNLFGARGRGGREG
jgi:hypothetical protein